MSELAAITIQAWGDHQECWTLDDGRVLTLRPIHRDDAPALQRAFDRLSPEEIRLRFLHPMTALSDEFAAQLCALDPRTGLALVLTLVIEGQDEIVAVARLAFAPAERSAEYAIIVAHALAGHGLGTLLMQRLIAASRDRGCLLLFGDVRDENQAMLDVCDALGFVRHSLAGEAGITRVELPLLADAPRPVADHSAGSATD